LTKAKESVTKILRELEAQEAGGPKATPAAKPKTGGAPPGVTVKRIQ